MDCTVYRAIIKVRGVWVESNNFQTVYRAALSEGKAFMHDYGHEVDALVIEIKKVTYPSFNEMIIADFMPEDIDYSHVAYLAIGNNGYTVDYRDGTLEVERMSY